MFKNYFKTAWRNLGKNKTFSIITIAGLAIGMASSILLLSYVSFQYSYDKFNKNAKNIYRVNLSQYQNNNLVFNSAENYPALAHTLKTDFPEVVDAARLYNMGYKNNCVFTYQNKYFKETKFFYADASFIAMFSFPFIEGDPKTALTQSFTAVISESFSHKFFRNENPIGKLIQMDDDDRNSELCKISGVFKDVPENSHIKFNILISYPTLYHRKEGTVRYEDSWNRKDFYTYILLRPGTNVNVLESKFPSFINKYIPHEKESHTENKLALQPLEKIHLAPKLNDEPEPTGNGKTIYFLLIIAVFIITIAWVNYINLSTTASSNRAKEIGIRKVLGSNRSQLIKQFLIESLIVNLVALLIALMVIILLQPALSKFFAVNFQFSGLIKNEYGLAFILFLFFGAFFSGLYPAFVLSSFKPTRVLKGKMSTSKSGTTLRQSLVIFQFSLSIFLIIGTFVVYQQVHYMLNQNLGIKVTQVLAINRPSRWDKSDSINGMRVQRFKDELKNNSAIEGIAMSNAIPGKEIRGQLDFHKKEMQNANIVSLNTIGIDDDYINVLGMTILAGRNFSKQYPTDENGLILTASAVQQLGYKTPTDAIEKQLLQGDVGYTIVGVTNDFHQQSLDKKAEPIAFQFNGNDYEADEYYLVKLNTTNVQQAVSHVQNVWMDTFKGNPFSFFFLDEYFNQQYNNEIQFGKLFGFFSLIAIVIACIGLVALVGFMIKQRTKEIGVRKVLGASVQDVLVLLTKEFIKLILLANLIAYPLGWLLMNNWLKDFAYRININWWIFFAAGLLAVIIALTTISFQAVKAAIANPVKSLRME